jgi:hypothetical protein
MKLNRLLLVVPWTFVFVEIFHKRRRRPTQRSSRQYKTSQVR